MDTSRIGPFALEERLDGAGGGSVFRAVHLQQRRSVALRVFPAPLVASSPAAKSALVAEIETLKKLKHPNIARCFGGILDKTHGCIACELVEGESLAAVLARRQRLAWETVVEYSLQISQALHCAHEQGVTHQRLAPEKIIVRPDDRLKIIDFRVDRAHNASCVSANKKTLERVKYAAPEQLRGEEPTHKSDLYALGCMMYEMLIGAVPFPAADIQEATRAHLEDQAERVDSVVFDCPVWLASLIGQLLDKDPVKRPYSAAAVGLALQETHNKMVAGTGVLDHAAGGFSALTPQVTKDEARDVLRKARREARKKQRPEDTQPFYEQAWFLVVCLLLLVGGVAAFMFWPVNEEKLFERAKAIVETREGREREAARPLLEKLLAKFPDGQYAEEAQVYIDDLDMASAERKLSFKLKLGREPTNEAERLYWQAWSFEQFGDRVGALDKYHSMVDLLSHEGPDRPYVNLARRQAAEIERQGASSDRLQFVAKRLADADQLAADGEQIEARKIYNSIITLYGHDREFEALVEHAQLQLSGKSAAAAPARDPPAAADENESQQ